MLTATNPGTRNVWYAARNLCFLLEQWSSISASTRNGRVLRSFLESNANPNPLLLRRDPRWWDQTNGSSARTTAVRYNSSNPPGTPDHFCFALLSTRRHPALWSFAGCDTGIPPYVSLQSTLSLLLTYVSFVEIEDTALFNTAWWRTEPGLLPRPKTGGFPSTKRLPSNTNTIPIPVPRYSPALLTLFKGNTTTTPRVCAVLFHPGDLSSVYTTVLRYNTRKIVVRLDVGTMTPTNQHRKSRVLLLVFTNYYAVECLGA